MWDFLVIIMSEHFLEINEKFYKDYDNWDKSKLSFSFNLGTPTDTFKRNFFCDSKNVTFDASKIIKIINKHHTITDEIIKQVPEIIKDPVIIILSLSSNSRIIFFSEVSDANGFPIIVILELLPTNSSSIKVVSTYSKDTNLQHFIDDSIILYISSDTTRVSHWEDSFGISLHNYTSGFNTEKLLEKNRTHIGC